MYQLPKANGPVIPQIPAVQGRRKFITISTEYQNPIKRITDSIQLDSFSQTEAYLRIIDFLQTLNSSVNNKKISDTCHESPIVVNIIKTLKKLEILVDEIPPEDTPQRFGNLSFRKWMEHLEQQANAIHVELFGAHDANQELIPYFLGGFGDQTRLDYGSGHELSFVGWLCCLDLLEILNEKDHQAVITRIFVAYLRLVRKLQLVYKLEPAGSHGVWGLDDYQFLPFFWGSSQLLNHPRIKPKSIEDQDLVKYFSHEYLYLGCIDFINTNKRGSFHEHSPILYDISGVAQWAKVNTGLLKMYIAEVLLKFPVVQHFLFGSLLPFEPTQVNL